MRPEEINIEWLDNYATFVDDEPFLLTVRKLEADPPDLVEEIDHARQQLHQAVDQIVDRALDGLRERDRALLRSEKHCRALAEELEVVVRHSNAMVIASARPSRADETIRDVRHDTIRDLRDVSAQIRVRAERPTVERLTSSRAGVLRVA
jgi:hypothetical protein